MEKCKCKRIKEGIINLKCPVHTGLPKVNKRNILKDEDKTYIIHFDSWKYQDVIKLD